jgi:dephospho-CoA kinase
VAIDETTQQNRLMTRDGISERAARQRLESQRPLREKIPLATWVIDNSGSPEATRQQVEALWRSWRESARVERPSSV